MKKIISLLFTAIVFTLSVTAQHIQVPAVVLSAFKQKFPNAVFVKWGKENAKEYEAAFESGKVKMSANFSTNGLWIETESSIKIAEISDSIRKAIISKYPAANITGAYKIEKADGTVLFEVEFKLNKKLKEVLLNVNGEFIN